jgi:Malonate decarboxylase, alpha subunit, transporter
MRTWREARVARDARIDAGRALAKHKLVEARDVVALLEAIIRPGDRVRLEGDNRKQADFLAQCLALLMFIGSTTYTWCNRASCYLNIRTCSRLESPSGLNTLTPVRYRGLIEFVTKEFTLP